MASLDLTADLSVLMPLLAPCRYDNGAIFTGSGTVVNGSLKLVYPGPESTHDNIAPHFKLASAIVI